LNGASLEVSVNEPNIGWQCYIKIQNIGTSSALLVGMPLISQYYTVFDTDNSRIGLGLVAYYYWNYQAEITTPPILIPLQSGFSGQVDYLMMAANVAVGTPAQNGMFLLATDTSLIMTPSANCSTCSPAEQFFDPASSSSFQIISASQVNSSEYMTTSSQVGSDNVCLGGVEIAFCLTST